MRLNGTGDRIDELEYPLTTDDLLREIGHHELDLCDGTETVEEALSCLQSETFQTPEDARFALYNGVSEKAIGRKGYSDRDPMPVGTFGPEQVSF